MATVPGDAGNSDVALTTGSVALAPVLQRLLLDLRQTVQVTLAELKEFDSHAGDFYPRALQDVTAQLEKISEAIDTLTRQSSSDSAVHRQDGGGLNSGGSHLQVDSATIGRAAEACGSQIAILRPLLRKYLRGPVSRAKGKLTSRAIRELYQEHDIPKVQKGLSWCEQAFTQAIVIHDA